MRAGLHVASRLLAVALAVSLLAGPAAEAQSRLPQRSVRIAWAGGAPRITASLAHLANAKVRRSLASGLRKTIVVTVQAYREGTNRLIAHHQTTCSVTYDLWEDNYIVRKGRTTTAHRSISRMLETCLTLRGLRVGAASRYRALRGTRVYFAFRAEFNPIGRSRCRRLLGNAGSDDPIGPVVVNLVRREICQAERSIDFRSQSVAVP